MRVHSNKLLGSGGIVKTLKSAVCCGVAEGYVQEIEARSKREIGTDSDLELSSFAE